MRLLYFLLFIFVLTPAPAPGTSDYSDTGLSHFENSTASTVKGRIVLTNSKVGARDASGVVIWLSSPNGPAPRSANRQKKVITQRDKRFLPHIIAIEVGSDVDFPNEDPFFHNVFSIYNGKRFDLGLYASGETRPVNFNRPGISYIFCNIHPHMSAVVVALETSHFAVSDKTGSFAIGSVPAGNYRLGIWHERARPETLNALVRSVRVGAAEMDLGAIRISEEGYVPRPHLNKHGQDYDSPHNRPGYRKP